MLLLASVLGWAHLLINGWVIASNVAWYLSNPPAELSVDDKLLLAASALVLLWGCCMSRRLRLLRFLTKVPPVVTLLHISREYGLELQFAHH